MSEITIKNITVQIIYHKYAFIPIHAVLINVFIY